MIRREVRKHERLTRLLRGMRRAVSRLPGRSSPSDSRAVVGSRRYPTAFRVRPRPGAIPEQWPAPPSVTDPFASLDGPDPIVEPVRYDLALFEQLNAEYASKPVAPMAPLYDAGSIARRSMRRLATIHDRIDLANKTVLEVGCGAGYEVWFLAHHFGCDAWGIDISARKAWPALAGANVHLVAGDIATSGSLPANAFDRVLSFTVWEHITRPINAIVELERVMKPGALAWLRANLYRGPTASHRTRDIAFPFPHLLFDDAVIDEAMRRAGRRPGGAAWVNRLTWEQYEAAFLEAGLVIRSADFTKYPLDEEFYRRFEDVLGRYPKADLERGFFQVVLEKPMSRAA